MRSAPSSEPEVATAGAYVWIGHLTAFMVGPTPDGSRLAVVRLGGHREGNETAWQCAAREVREEAALDILPVLPPETFWLHHHVDPSQMRVQPYQNPASDDTGPILVVDDLHAVPPRRSVMYIARAAGSPIPSAEAKGLLLLRASDVKWIARGGVTLGDYVAVGGQAMLSEPLAHHLPLEPFLQLRVLAHLLEQYPDLGHLSERSIDEPTGGLL